MRTDAAFLIYFMTKDRNGYKADQEMRLKLDDMALEDIGVIGEGSKIRYRYQTF